MQAVHPGCTMSGPVMMISPPHRHAAHYNSCTARVELTIDMYLRVNILQGRQECDLHISTTSLSRCVSTISSNCSGLLTCKHIKAQGKHNNYRYSGTEWLRSVQASYQQQLSALPCRCAIASLLLKHGVQRAPLLISKSWHSVSVGCYVPSMSVDAPRQQGPCCC
jgi:hypothetical protein